MLFNYTHDQGLSWCHGEVIAIKDDRKKTPDLAQHNPFKLLRLMNAQQCLVKKIDNKSHFLEEVTLII